MKVPIAHRCKRFEMRGWQCPLQEFEDDIDPELPDPEWQFLKADAFRPIIDRHPRAYIQQEEADRTQTLTNFLARTNNVNRFILDDAISQQNIFEPAIKNDEVQELVRKMDHMIQTPMIPPNPTPSTTGQPVSPLSVPTTTPSSVPLRTGQSVPRGPLRGITLDSQGMLEELLAEALTQASRQYNFQNRDDPGLLPADSQLARRFNGNRQLQALQTAAETVQEDNERFQTNFRDHRRRQQLYAVAAAEGYRGAQKARNKISARRTSRSVDKYVRGKGHYAEFRTPKGGGSPTPGTGRGRGGFFDNWNDQIKELTNRR